MPKGSAKVVDPLEWAKAYLTKDEYAQLLSALEEPLDASIRINTLKWETVSAALKLAERYGWALERVPFCKDGFWIRGGKLSPSATIEHRLGYYYIQEAASMLPPTLFDFNSAARPFILDMAASPGGKTTHLTALTNDCGLILANDSSRARIPPLQTVLRKWGAINQCVTCLPGEVFGQLYTDHFDAVLLDAPCSMQGLRTSESHTPRGITQSEIESLSVRQRRLLESALRAAKTGGQIVYATCTLAPQEDELVLEETLERFGGLIQIDDVRNRLPAAAPALKMVDDKHLAEEISHALRLWPHTLGTAGFFAARLTKLADLPSSDYSQLRKISGSTLFTSASPKLSSTVVAQIKDAYGFELTALMDKHQLALALRKGRISLIPERLMSEYLQFPILSAGMEIGKLVEGKFLPTHEFIARFGDQFTRGVLTLDDPLVDAWTRGEDLRGFNCAEAAKGKIYAIRDRCGRNLGCGKLLEGRLKNMLPTHLF